MKLIKLEIGNIPKEKQYRSLNAGFKVEFHSLDNKGIKAMEGFNPFCFAGLNGSGKSNVLEALASIFYHLECCVGKFKPQSFATHFRPHECNPDAFTLEYLIWRKGEKDYLFNNFYKVIIKKDVDSPPRLFRQVYPFSDSENLIEESINPPKQKRNQEPEPAPAKIYLPDIVIGYSSGENEILSIPFRKSRLINFDKYRQDSLDARPFEEPENSLIYIDAAMSQAVLLSCLLFEDEATLKPLRRELGIVGLQSFRININNYELHKLEGGNKTVKAVNHCKEFIEKLKRCATSWNELDLNVLYEDNSAASILILDFFVDKNTKNVFKDCFKTSFDLFRFFQVLYELNSIVISESLKEEVYKSKGFYTDGKLPEGSPEENVFFFLDYLILKEITGESKPKALLLREFSDGEHQFLHTMGICLMLKDRKSILLLDEPETHFNPSWRAKFIKILGDSIKAGSNEKSVNSSFNVHYLKDILLTSHSPFIISDCMPNNVIFFDRNEETKKIQARKAADLGINTYGTSVEMILDELFDYNQTIGDLSNDILKNIDFKEIKSIEDVENTKKSFSHLGESIEKDLVLARLNQLKFAP